MKNSRLCTVFVVLEKDSDIIIENITTSSFWGVQFSQRQVSIADIERSGMICTMYDDLPFDVDKGLFEFANFYDRPLTRNFFF